MIGAALTSFDQSTESIEDEEIGTIKFYIKTWNVNKNEGLSWKELKQRPCQTSDFDQESNQSEASGFYQTNPVSVADIAAYGGKLKCIDEYYEISGTYDTSIGSSLQIVFEKCDPDVRVCKQRAFINDWIKYKYIYTF